MSDCDIAVHSDRGRGLGISSASAWTVDVELIEPGDSIFRQLATDGTFRTMEVSSFAFGALLLAEASKPVAGVLEKHTCEPIGKRHRGL